MALNIQIKNTMGVHYDVYQLYKSYFTDLNLKYGELGAQYVCGGPWGAYGPPYFKDVFKDLNITSFDVTGENNSLDLDLSKPILEQEKYVQYINFFDILTNFGTTEHVQDQYICWKNVFDLLKINGIIISDVPKVDNWHGHCKFYYDENFFKSLHNDFNILEYSEFTISQHLTTITCVLQKTHKNSFITSNSDLYKNLHIVENFVDVQGR